MSIEQKSPQPRGPHGEPWLGERNTWIESEDFAYNGMNRRARVVRKTDQKLMVVRCGIPDTFFSIPVRGGGYITRDNGVFYFHPKVA